MKRIWPLLLFALSAGAQDVPRVALHYTGNFGQYFRRYPVPAGTIFSVRKNTPDEICQLAENGSIRMAVTTRPLAGPGLTSVKIAFQAPVLAVHRVNRLRSITSAQARSLLEKNYGSWRTFNGPSARIRLYIKASPELPPPVMNREHHHGPARPRTIYDLPPLGGVPEQEQKPLPTIQYSRPLRLQTESDAKSFSLLCTDPLGMACFDITRFDENRVHVLAIDDITPTLENFRAGSYPLLTVWYLTLPIEPTDAEQALIRYIRSTKFARLLYRDGLLPELLTETEKRP